MKVTLTKDYRVAPEGHTTLKFKEGDEVDGKVAECAVRDGAAEKPKKRGPKPKKQSIQEPEFKKPDFPDHEG